MNKEGSLYLNNHPSVHLSVKAKVLEWELCSECVRRNLWSKVAGKGKVISINFSHSRK